MKGKLSLSAIPRASCPRTNWEVFNVVLRRSMGKNTKARTIRQSPHMISEGGYELIAQKTM